MLNMLFKKSLSGTYPEQGYTKVSLTVFIRVSNKSSENLWTFGDNIDRNYVLQGNGLCVAGQCKVPQGIPGQSAT
jgi:hypothetical protein